MNSNGFEKVEFNFNCNFDLEDEDASNESDPLALVHDSSFNSNDDGKGGKMVISSVSTSLPVNVNKIQNSSNKSNLECEPQSLKRAALTPILSSSPRKRLVTVIPKPRPQLHNVLKMQAQADTTISTTTKATIITTPQVQAPTIGKINQPSAPLLSSSTTTSSSIITPSTLQNSTVLQSKTSPESQSNNTSLAVKSPIHTINNTNNSSSRPILSTSESGIQMPIIKSVISLQQQKQPIVENIERPLVQSKTTTNGTTSAPSRQIASPTQFNNFVSNPRISLTSLLASVKKAPYLAPFILAPSTLGRPPGPGPSSILARNNNNSQQLRPITHVEKINAANNNYPNNIINITTNNNNNSETNNSWKYFKCEHCDKSFWQEILLTEHMKKHNPNKPFKCTECDRSYISKNLLLLHFESHTGFKTLQCHLCSQTFRRQTSLTLHLQGHNGIFPYSCAMCEKSFLRSGSLRIHQLNTHQVVLPLDAMDDGDEKDSS